MIKKRTNLRVKQRNTYDKVLDSKHIKRRLEEIAKLCEEIEKETMNFGEIEIYGVSGKYDVYLKFKRSGGYHK